MATLVSRVRWIVLLGATILAGCSTTVGQYQPALESQQQLRTFSPGKMAVADFYAAPELPAARDRQVTVRGTAIYPPAKSGYARYLGAALAAELSAAGRLDPESPVQITGELTRNELNAAGVSEGSATVAARVRVTRAGQVRYDKLLDASNTWNSSFIGAVAIPMAINEYTALYRKLLAQLFSDVDFQAAAEQDP